jgi:outer membrane lipoprotein-sorting protein
MRFVLQCALGFILIVAPSHLMAQRDDTLLPDPSAAKAKAILSRVITALGDRAYLNARDTDCSGRIAQFGRNNELMGYTNFHDMWQLPDKRRTEYIVKGENSIAGFLLGIDGLGISHGGSIITVFNGNQGWMLDKAGVSDQPEDVVKAFSEQVKSNMNNLLRSRINEPGMEFRYAGTDLLDLKEVDWIEISDRDHRSFRLAVDKATNLPTRWVVMQRDPETREQSEVVTLYAQFIPFDGVQTPIRTSLIENDVEVSQSTVESCRYNSSPSADLFSRASLDQRAPEFTKKGYKEKQNKK